MKTVPIEAIAAGLKAAGSRPPLRVECLACLTVLSVPKYQMVRCGCKRIGLDGPPERPRIIGVPKDWRIVT